MSEFTTVLHEALQEYAIPNGNGAYFAKVFKGEPSALFPSNGPPICRWATTGTRVAPEGPRTLRGERMLAAVFGVFVYWPLAATEGAQQSQEDDISTVMVDLPATLVGLSDPDALETYTLAGKTVQLVTVEDPTLVERAFPFPSSEVEMRILTLEVHARMLEAS